jgi:hypothetical protein
MTALLPLINCSFNRSHISCFLAMLSLYFHLSICYNVAEISLQHQLTQESRRYICKGSEKLPFLSFVKAFCVETITKQAKRSALSAVGERVLVQCERRRIEEDLTGVTIRNYLSKLRHFVAWYASIWKQEREEEPFFPPGAVTTPACANYRICLQQEFHFSPSRLLRLKRSAAALLAFASSLQKPQTNTTPLFLFERRCTQLPERRSGYVIKKYADRARVSDVIPHDLWHRFGYRLAQSTPLHRLLNFWNSICSIYYLLYKAQEVIFSKLERLLYWCREMNRSMAIIQKGELPVVCFPQVSEEAYFMIEYPQALALRMVRTKRSS